MYFVIETKLLKKIEPQIDFSNLNDKQKRQEKLLQITFLAKSHPCEICGIQYNPWQMDLDHINPETKVDHVSNLRALGRPEYIIKEEITKCRVLCAACHRILSISKLRNKTN